jgi:hypothetical protein
MALTRPKFRQIQSAKIEIDDPLIVLNKSVSGANTRDIGFVFERGDSTNVALIWDESDSELAFINTAEAGNTAGDVTISSYANLKVETLTATTLTGSFTGNAATATTASGVVADSVALTTDTTGNYVQQGATSGNGISGSVNSEGGTFTVTSSAVSTNTADTIVYRDTSKNFSAGTVTLDGLVSASLTYPTSDGTDGQALTTDGAGTLSFSTITGGEQPDGTISSDLTTIISVGNMLVWYVDDVTNAITLTNDAVWTISGGTVRFVDILSGNSL